MKSLIPTVVLAISITSAATPALAQRYYPQPNPAPYQMQQQWYQQEAIQQQQEQTRIQQEMLNQMKRQPQQPESKSTNPFSQAEREFRDSLKMGD
jgi:hypothetical protein